MVRVERIDNIDSFQTEFKVEIQTNRFQHILVNIWDADDVEAKIKSLDFDTLKSKSDRSDVLV